MFQNMPKANNGNVSVENGTFMRFNSKRYIKFRPTKAITYDDFKDAPYKLVTLCGRDLYLKYDTNRYVRLFTTKDNGDESYVYVGYNVADSWISQQYKIFDIKRINHRSIWIAATYPYSSTNSQIYPYTLYNISIENDGTLYSYTQYYGTNFTTIYTSGSYSSLNDIKPIIIPGLYRAGSGFECRLGSFDMLSSGGRNFHFSEYGNNDWKGSLIPPNSGTHRIQVTNNHVDNYIPDPTIINARGGLFFKYGGSSYTELTAPYIEIFAGGGMGGYNQSVYKYSTLTNADPTGKLQSLGVVNHYVMGTTSDDYIITTQIDMTDPTKYVYHFYLWELYMKTYTTDYNWLYPYSMSEYDSVIEKPAGTKLLTITNDVIVFDDLTRYQIRPRDRIITQVASIDQEISYNDLYTDGSEIGPESDPFFGVYIWGD